MMPNKTLNRIFAFLLTNFITLSAASAESENRVDQAIDDALNGVATFLEGIVFYSIPVGGSVSLPIVLAILGGTAVFLTIYFKFINIRALGLAFRTVKGKYTPDDAPGQITHFQALTAALSATVGLGNIAGVAVAIGLGGPGATFWMIVMGLCGMTTKFAECTLGVKYRQFDKEGNTHGGAMYYLRDGLAERGLGKLGKFLAVFFAIMCIAGAIGAGNMFQVNQAANQFTGTFGLLTGDNQIYFGVILAVLVGMVLIGGIKSIARVTSFLVPFMCGIYLLAAAYILVSHASFIPGAFQEIIQGAFSPTAIGGGIVGVLIQGIKRAAFSNEAGIGSSPIAHSAVKTEKPASEGLVALLEPFTDTVVVCTMTALVLVISGTWKVDGITKEDQVALYSSPAIVQEAVTTLPADSELRILSSKEVGETEFGEVYMDGKEETLWVNMDQVTPVAGIQKTSLAFDREVDWFPEVLAIAVILFAFSTMISWAYYGEQAINYLFGHENKIADITYKLVFCLFTIVGSVASIGNVVRLSDAMLFAMVIPNMIGIYLLLPVIRKEFNDFKAYAKKIDEEKG